MLTKEDCKLLLELINGTSFAGAHAEKVSDLKRKLVDLERDAEKEKLPGG